MGCIGHYEVVQQTFEITSSTPTLPPPDVSDPRIPYVGNNPKRPSVYEVVVEVPPGKVALGAGIEFDWSYYKEYVTYTGRPATDGSSWTFWVVPVCKYSWFGKPWTGTAYVTVAEMG